MVRKEYKVDGKKGLFKSDPDDFFWIKTDRGNVIHDRRWSDTKVSGGGGWPVKTTIEERHQITIRTDGGEEWIAELGDKAPEIREGSHLFVWCGGRVGQDRGPVIRILDLNTRRDIDTYPSPPYLASAMGFPGNPSTDGGAFDRLYDRLCKIGGKGGVQTAMYKDESLTKPFC